VVIFRLAALSIVSVTEAGKRSKTLDVCFSLMACPFLYNLDEVSMESSPIQSYNIRATEYIGQYILLYHLDIWALLISTTPSNPQLIRRASRPMPRNSGGLI
jgi:hypothetical protein